MFGFGLEVRGQGLEVSESVTSERAEAPDSIGRAKVLSAMPRSTNLVRVRVHRLGLVGARVRVEVRVRARVGARVKVRARSTNQ